MNSVIFKREVERRQLHAYTKCDWTTQAAKRYDDHGYKSTMQNRGAEPGALVQFGIKKLVLFTEPSADPGPRSVL